MKKIFAIAIALMMVLALSVSVFAADSGSFTVTVINDWWEQETFYNLTGESIEGHETLTISCTDGGKLIICYMGDEWTQLDTPADGVYVVDLSIIPDDDNLFVILSNAAGNTYTVEWAFNGSAAAPAEEATEEAAAPEETVASSNEEAPAETAEAPAEATAPATGVALAVVPAVISIAAVAVSKKR